MQYPTSAPSSAPQLLERGSADQRKTYPASVGWVLADFQTVEHTSQSGPADLVEQSDSRVLTPFYAGTLANTYCNFKLERMVFKASASTIEPFSVGNSHDLE
jgi:hypothetical protein